MLLPVSENQAIFPVVLAELVRGLQPRHNVLGAVLRGSVLGLQEEKTLSSAGSEVPETTRTPGHATVSHGNFPLLVATVVITC